MRIQEWLENHVGAFILFLVVTGILLSVVGVLMIWKSLSG